MSSEVTTRSSTDEVENFSQEQSQAAAHGLRAPERAWEPLGPEMHRSHDVWVAFPERNWESRTQELMPKSGEGLRMRLVLHELDAGANLERLRPVLESLPTADYRFIHAEVMQGPEEGVFLAVDNRLPGLLTQTHLSRPAAQVLTTYPPELPENGCPVHANLVVHDEVTSLTDWYGDNELAAQLESLSEWLGQQGLALHQLSLGRVSDSRGGFSLGLECITEERGSQGGFQA